MKPRTPRAPAKRPRSVPGALRELAARLEELEKANAERYGGVELNVHAQNTYLAPLPIRVEALHGKVDKQARRLDRLTDLMAQTVAAQTPIVEALREQHRMLGKFLGPIGNLQTAVESLTRGKP